MNNLEKKEENLDRRKTLSIHDSLSNQNEEIALEKEALINLYLCGPTVYNHIHIGNLRPVVFFDLIVRILRLKKVSYRYIQNITDIDDKIVNQSLAEEKEESELAEYYTSEYMKILEELDIIKPEFHLVTANIQTISNFVERLVESKKAYVGESSVLFSIDRNSREYGKLSKQIVEKLSRKKGRQIKDQQKRNQEDFVLWKKTTKGVSWKNKWFDGRPGWHSECAAIIDKAFGRETIDIHGGGKDLLFPHHENERIQYIAANNRELSKIWIHFGFILSQKAKMSKSEGNHWIAKDFIRKYGTNVLKMLLLESRYNEDIEVNEEILTQVIRKVRKIENIMKRISLYLYFEDSKEKKENEEEREKIVNLLLNNLETSKVMNILDEKIGFINRKINHLSEQESIGPVIDSLLFGFEMMGFSFQVRKYSEEEKKNLNTWKKLTVEKKYKEADSLRESLQKRGII